METFREIKISLSFFVANQFNFLAMIHYVENLMDCLSIQKNYHQTPLSLTANTIRLLGSKFVQINIAPCSSRQSAQRPIIRVSMVSMGTHQLKGTKLSSVVLFHKIKCIFTFELRQPFFYKMLKMKDFLRPKCKRIIFQSVFTF